MKVSSRVDYAFSCIIIIAEKYRQKEPISVKYIAKRERLAADYVEQLLITMKRAGILKSVRGMRGGNLLAKAPRNISTFDIVRAFEGDILELVCLRTKGRQRKCIHLNRCQIKKFWLGLRKAMETYLHHKTLDQLLLLRKKER